MRLPFTAAQHYWFHILSAADGFSASVCGTNRYRRRFLLQVDDSTDCSVPPQWTDMVSPDPEMAMGKGRAFFRIADLLGLAGLLGPLVAAMRGKHSGKV